MVLLVSEVKSLTGMSKKAIRRLFDQGRLRGYRVPGTKTRKIPVEYLFDYATDYGRVDIRRVLIENYSQELKRLSRI